MNKVTQSFEVYQRHAVAGEVCRFLAEVGCRSVATVGDCCAGLEGHLPDEIKCQAAIGLSLRERDCPIIGIPTALPLQDRSVDVAISCGVLEHVTEREAVINEMNRVAKQATVITSSWKSEPVELVERTLDQWHRQLTGMGHPWLTDHIRLGLPRREEAVEALRRDDLHVVELACGSLAEWTFLQIALLIHDILPVKHVNFAEFNCDYNRGWSKVLTTHLPPSPGRTVLVGLRDAQSAERLTALADRPPATPPLAEGLAMADAMITAMQQALSEGERRLEEQIQVQSQDFNVVVQRQAEEIESLREQIRELEKSSRPTSSTPIP